MRIRSLKPEFWRSLTIARLPVPARLTMIGSLNYCDDEGRGIDSPHLIKAALYPLDDDVAPSVVDSHLLQMEDVGLIVRYREATKRYLAVTNWEEHQRIDHPKPSLYPAPPSELIAQAREGLAQLRADFATVPENGARLRAKSPPEVEQGTGSREQGDGLVNTAPLPRRDELFEAVAEVCGIDYHDLTDPGRGSLNKATSQIRAKCQDPDEARRRAANWQYDVPMTPPTLAKHWAALGTSKPRLSRQTNRLLALADDMEGR